MAGITRAIGDQPPNPNRDEVRLVQQLLNKYRTTPLRPIEEDGREGPETKAAIEDFQRRVVKMPHPDGRVDPNGATFKALAGDKPLPQKPAGNTAPVALVFRHQGKQPTGVTGLAGAKDTKTATRYESLVSVTGGVMGSFKGSIYPDNMDIKGRLVDGTYDLYLGFHKPSTPKASDLVMRTNGFRAVLVVNANRAVSVTSNLASKKTSDGIHVHNGWANWKADVPMSEGCLILHPTDWPAFIQLFLDAYPDLADWTAGGGRLGKKIGTVTVMP